MFENRRAAHLQARPCQYTIRCMSLAQLTSTAAVNAAIEEYDRLGRDEFLRRYGFGESREYFLVAGEKKYDSKAIAGVAHGHQFPHLGPLTSTMFSGGKSGAARRLRDLGFQVHTISGRK